LVADPQKNTETVIACYNMAFNERKPYSRRHTEVRRPPLHPAQPPGTRVGFEAFVGFVEGSAEQFPRMSLEIRRAIAEGDMVVTHSLLKTSPEDRGSAVADFFGLQDGKVVEHRDVLQPLPERAPPTTTPCSGRPHPRAPPGGGDASMPGWFYL
jgi:predicted SnoaL-like aldol condensation-catalyzing enzyme